MRKLLLVQFSNDMLNKNEDQQAKNYYDKLYRTRSGYHRFGPTWEIPLWIAQVVYNFPKADVLFADSMDDIWDRIDDTNCECPNVLVFSVLDCNKHLIREIANKFSGPVFVGGYCDKDYFEDLYYDNVYWCDTIEKLCQEFDVQYKPDIRYKKDYKSGVDYHHFAGAKTIARLTMSTGCNNNCKFCTISNKVETVSNDTISQQLGAMLSAHLNSSLIYIDDKTFGQAKNYMCLPAIFNGMKIARQMFDGFIIQTTASQLLKLDDDFLLTSGICYVELGIESYNNEILRAMNKPATEKTIQAAVDKLKRLGIKVIPNIMIGLPGETIDTYGKTLAWLCSNIDAISHVNVYTHVDYENECGDENRGGDNELDKSFARKVYGFGNKALDRG